MMQNLWERYVNEMINEAFDLTCMAQPKSSWHLKDQTINVISWRRRCSHVIWDKRAASRIRLVKKYV